jgi:hypothetical protein
MIPVTVKTLLFVVICFSLAGCGSYKAGNPEDTLELFENGVRTSNRQLITDLLYDRVETIAPDENSSLTRDEFLDRVLRHESNLVGFELRIQEVKISGNRASVRVEETGEVQFPEGRMKTTGSYSYEMIQTGASWKIFRITKHL